MFNEIERILQYPMALILSNSQKKTCESLGEELGASGDKMLRFLEHSQITVKSLISLAKQIFGRSKKLHLLIDDTLISKEHSQIIEGTSDNYSPTDKTVRRSLCSVVAALTDGKRAIPIDQAIWTSLEFNTGQYQTKFELAQRLIDEIKAQVAVEVIVMDGLYATQVMLNWLNNKNIRFEMRFHANRVITHQGVRAQIRNHPALKLSGRQTEKTIAADWMGIMYYFTVSLRRKRNGDFVLVYQVSNYKTSATNHKRIYGYRWDIEKFFRTAKQSLGLGDCQVRSISKQKAHIMNVFYAYAIAQAERKKRRLKNVESAIKSIRSSYLSSSKSPILRSRQNFSYA